MAEQVSRMTPETALDSDGNPVSGALSYFDRSGTATAETVYTDATLTTAHPRPLVANAGGVFAEVFHSGTIALKVTVTDNIGGSLYTIDPIPLTSTATDAGNITFTPITGNAATDVQSAIANNTETSIAASEATLNAGTIVTTAGTGNAYTLVAAETITAYEVGQTFLVRFDRANTGTATLNVDGLGAKTLKKWNSSGALALLGADDFLDNEVHTLIYDGTVFVILLHKATNDLRGIVKRSTSAENLAGTETHVYPDVAGVKEMIDEHGWWARCTFDGSPTGAYPITLSPVGATAFNVTDITKDGIGDYTVNFTTNVTNSNYQLSIATNDYSLLLYQNRQLGSIRIVSVNTVGTPTDPTDISISIIG